MFESTFTINQVRNNRYNGLEKDADYYMQTLEQCEGNFRVISQHIIPAMILIGNQNPSLIVPHLTLLASSQFIGGYNHIVIKSVLMGLERMVDVNLVFKSLIRIHAKEQVVVLLSRIGSLNDRGWVEVKKTAESLLNKLGNHLPILPPQQHISPERPFDHLEVISKLISSAKSDVFIIDPYVSDDIRYFLAYLRESDGLTSKLRILTRTPDKKIVKEALEFAIKTFLNQGNEAELRYDSKKVFHDRWCIIDNVTIYKVGASFNKILQSNKSFGVELLEGVAAKKAMSDILSWWDAGQCLNNYEN